MTIKFGASGWRGVIADEFTFENARRATEAICRYLRPVQKLLAAGRDYLLG